MDTSVSDILLCLEQFAPYTYQEKYDNSGLLVGNLTTKVSGVLVCLDSTEDIVLEAIDKGCNVIVSHHPILFSGLKRLTGSTYIERTVSLAIKHDIAIIACHTNLDNIIGGVNTEIANRIGLKDCKILSPKKNILRKLITYSPPQNADDLKEALFNAGAGSLGNYSECSFNTTGLGTYKGNAHSTPHLGEKNARHYQEEIKIEVLLELTHLKKVLKALLEVHPYEEVAYEIVPIENEFQEVGSGMIGMLPKPIPLDVFLLHLKKVFNLSVVKHTKPLQKKIQKVAICGGSGIFLLSKAKREKADIYITSDVKYHEFFDAEEQIVLADIGHYESEQYTNTLLKRVLSQKFSNFAILITEHNTNPVTYYI